MINRLKNIKARLIKSASEGTIFEDEIHIEGTIIRSGTIAAAGAGGCSQLVFIIEEMPGKLFQIQSWATGYPGIALTEKGDKVSFAYQKGMGRIIIKSFVNHSYEDELLALKR